MSFTFSIWMSSALFNLYLKKSWGGGGREWRDEGGWRGGRKVLEKGRVPEAFFARFPVCASFCVKKNNRNNVKSQCVNGDVKYKEANHSTVLFTAQHSTAQHSTPQRRKLLNIEISVFLGKPRVFCSFSF